MLWVMDNRSNRYCCHYFECTVTFLYFVEVNVVNMLLTASVL